jgi:hypothetical protein
MYMVYAFVEMFEMFEMLEMETGTRLYCADSFSVDVTDNRAGLAGRVASDRLHSSTRVPVSGHD